MSERRKPTPISHTEFILNFRGDTKNIYVDENDLCVDRPKFPRAYEGAFKNPWFCYDAALIRIKEEAIKNNPNEHPRDIKLFTTNKLMRESQAIFAKNDRRTSDGALFFGSEPKNKLELIPSINPHDGSLGIINHFTLSNVIPVRGRIPRSSTIEDIDDEIKHFSGIFKREKNL
jgi:hypothetical protein